MASQRLCVRFFQPLRFKDPHVAFVQSVGDFQIGGRGQQFSRNLLDSGCIRPSVSDRHVEIDRSAFYVIASWRIERQTPNRVAFSGYSSPSNTGCALLDTATISIGSFMLRSLSAWIKKKEIVIAQVLGRCESSQCARAELVATRDATEVNDLFGNKSCFGKVPNQRDVIGPLLRPNCEMVIVEATNCMASGHGDDRGPRRRRVLVKSWPRPLLS